MCYMLMLTMLRSGPRQSLLPQVLQALPAACSVLGGVLSIGSTVHIGLSSVTRQQQWQQWQQQQQVACEATAAGRSSGTVWHPEHRAAPAACGAAPSSWLRDGGARVLASGRGQLPDTSSNSSSSSRAWFRSSCCAATGSNTADSNLSSRHLPKKGVLVERCVAGAPTLCALQLLQDAALQSSVTQLHGVH